MNHEQEGLKNQIDAARVILIGLLAKCTHHVSPGTGLARCEVCQQDFHAWCCAQSPDRVCHYVTSSSDDLVHLINGDKVPPPSGHVVEHETEDRCIFCGHPFERK